MFVKLGVRHKLPSKYFSLSYRDDRTFYQKGFPSILQTVITKLPGGIVDELQRARIRVAAAKVKVAPLNNE